MSQIALSEFIERWIAGLVLIGIIWVQTHFHPRDRVTRYAFPIIATVLTMLLIHLPRVELVARIKAPVIRVDPTNRNVDLTFRP